MDPSSITQDTLLTTATFDELFALEFESEEFFDLLGEIQAVARKLKMKSDFDKRYDVRAKKQSKSALKPLSICSMTQFNAEDYPEMRCGNYICTASGVKSPSMMGEVTVCHHPIMPIKRLSNTSTGLEKIILAYQRDGVWHEITVDKSVTSSASKIVALSPMGVMVTSESARALVKYLADLEALNPDLIPSAKSTSKMGWINKSFVPYTDDVVFDGYGQFARTYKSISSKGSYDKWLKFALEVRKAGRIEPRLMMAASFASVLIPAIEIQPFIVDLWGDTGGGKTLSMMLGVSIWADPNREGPYVTSFNTTSTAAEVLCNFFNNLPFAIDESTEIKDKLGPHNTMSSWIYGICSGKGKDRSNRELGINDQTTWANVIMSTGEHSIADGVNRAGSINRVISINCGYTDIFSDGNAVATLLCNNYGHAGRPYIEAVKSIGADAIKERFLNARKNLSRNGKMGKQTLDMVALMIADEIATEYIFKDGLALDEETLINLISDKRDVSENDRCYEYIMDVVSANINKFVTHELVDSQYGSSRVKRTPSNDIWGEYDDRKPDVIINKTIFDKLCSDGGFASDTFLSWAKEHGYIECDKTEQRRTVKKRINGVNTRCVVLTRDRAKCDATRAEASALE